MTDTVILVYDRAGATKSMKVSDDGSGVLTPYHAMDTTQHQQLLDALGDLVSTAHTRTDISGAIGTGGTSQPLLAADPNNMFLFLMNPKDATESLWVQDAKTGAGADQSAAVNDGKSFELAPGESYTWPNGIGNRVSIVAATTGHVFLARKA